MLLDWTTNSWWGFDEEVVLLNEIEIRSMKKFMLKNWVDYKFSPFVKTKVPLRYLILTMFYQIDSIELNSSEMLYVFLR